MGLNRGRYGAACRNCVDPVRGGSNGSSLFGVGRPFDRRHGELATRWFDVPAHDQVGSGLLGQLPPVSGKECRNLLRGNPELPQLLTLPEPAVQRVGTVQVDAVDEIPST